MLDVMSGGRVISGFVRGIGCEYLSLGVNPTYSRERFYEAHDLIVRAWTEPAARSRFEGKHYRCATPTSGRGRCSSRIRRSGCRRRAVPRRSASAARSTAIRSSASSRRTRNTKRLLDRVQGSRRNGSGITRAARAARLRRADLRRARPTRRRARGEAAPALALPPRPEDPAPLPRSRPGYLSEDTLRSFLLAGVRPPSELSFEELERDGYVLVGSATHRARPPRGDPEGSRHRPVRRRRPHRRHAARQGAAQRRAVRARGDAALPPARRAASRAAASRRGAARSAAVSAVHRRAGAPHAGAGAHAGPRRRRRRAPARRPPIAAARHGAETMLVERYGSLGGLATGGLIILLLTLDDGDGHQVIGGLCQELVDRIVQRGGAFHPPRGEWGAARRGADRTRPPLGAGLGLGTTPGALLGRLRPGGVPLRAQRAGRGERRAAAAARLGLRAARRGLARRGRRRAEEVGPRRHPGRRRHRRDRRRRHLRRRGRAVRAREGAAVAVVPHGRRRGPRRGARSRRLVLPHRGQRTRC